MKMKKTKQVKKSAIGLLFGRVDGGTIKNCSVSGQIIINGEPQNYDIGGIAGSATYNTEIVNSSADVKVIITNDTNPNVIHRFKALPKWKKIGSLAGLIASIITIGGIIYKLSQLL